MVEYQKTKPDKIVKEARNKKSIYVVWVHLC